MIIIVIIIIASLKDNDAQAHKDEPTIAKGAQCKMLHFT